MSMGVLVIREVISSRVVRGRQNGSFGEFPLSPKSVPDQSPKIKALKNPKVLKKSKNPAQIALKIWRKLGQLTLWRGDAAEASIARSGCSSQ